MRVLFATAELAPLARVGGLAEAAAGLVLALRRLGVEVEVALPDYVGHPLEDEEWVDLDVPHWAQPARARRGTAAGFGAVTLVDVPGIARPHPYLAADGTGFWDNDERFFRFSAAVAALARATEPDVLHLNDWHTGAALAFLPDPPASVLTVHTLGYQGNAHPGWLDAFPHHGPAYLHGGTCNPLAGAIRLADLVLTVSPTYAREILTPEGGFGLDGLLRQRAERGDLLGIRNGIDAERWNPATDPHLPAPYDAVKPKGKAVARRALLDELGLDDGAPLVVCITRLVEQKGVDLLLATVPYFRRMPARLAVLGAGDAWLADGLRAAQAAHPRTVAFREGYDEALAHRLFAGGDLLVMPSRFEPCGLAQMQAMRYGTLPVVTDVGGLHDTVVDVDVQPSIGTGVVARAPDPLALLDALHRGVRIATDPKRLADARRRGMTHDWSWAEPAQEHLDRYRERVTAPLRHGG